MDDQSGLFTFLTGIVVVVVASVFLSLMVEKRFAFSREKITVGQSVNAGAEEISTLRRHLADSSERHEGLEGRLSQINDRAEKLMQRTKQQAMTIQQLKSRSAELKTDLAGLNRAFVDYQTTYRNRVWSDAIGDEMLVLKTRSGREYLDVKILNVTHAGIDIHHQTGRSRIAPSEFPDDWQDRFQWRAPGSRWSGE